MTTTQVSVDSFEITSQVSRSTLDNTRVSVERFAITNPDGRSIHFVEDNDLRVVLTGGGDENARYAEAGVVVVLLGINGEGFDYVKVDPCRGANGQLETLRAARRSLSETIETLEGFRANHAAIH
jgi:hypothetical protein